MKTKISTNKMNENENFSSNLLTVWVAV